MLVLFLIKKKILYDTQDRMNGYIGKRKKNLPWNGINLILRADFTFLRLRLNNNKRMNFLKMFTKHSYIFC